MFQGREVGAELVLVMCVQGMLLMSTSGRLGVVLAKQGGALAKLLPIFQLGGGGILGSAPNISPVIRPKSRPRAFGVRMCV